MSGYIGAAVIALLLAAIEFWGSSAARSISLLGDAFHVSADLAFFIVAGYTLRLKRKHPAEAEEFERRYGMLTAWLLVLSGIFTGGMGAAHLFELFESKVHHETLLPFALLGLGGNVLMLFILHRYHIGHDHGHSASETHHSAFWHTALDTASSAVVVGVAVMRPSYMTDHFWRSIFAHADAVAALIICGILLYLGFEKRQRLRKP